MKEEPMNDIEKRIDGVVARWVITHSIDCRSQLVKHLTTLYRQLLLEERKRLIGVVERERKAFRAIEYDGDNLKSASDVYHCHFETWNEVIRYEQGIEETYNIILTTLNKEKD